MPDRSEQAFRRVRLTEPQRQLLEEIKTAGVLYIRRHGPYHRTVQALLRKGAVRCVEPDYSRFGADGWAAT